MNNIYGKRQIKSTKELKPEKRSLFLYIRSLTYRVRQNGKWTGERGKLKKKEFSYAGNLFKETNNIYGKLQTENKTLLGNDPSKQVLFQHSKPNFILGEIK